MYTRMNAGLLASVTAACALVGAGSTAAHAVETHADSSTCVRAFQPPPDTGDAPFGVTAGPGGTWYGDGTTISRIRDGRTTTWVVPGVDTSSSPGVGWLTWDGGTHIWFAVRSDGRLGTITGDGTISTVQVPDGADGQAVPQGIVVHPGRDVWFTDQANNRIGDLSLRSGGFTFYTVPSDFPLGLVEGRDHDLYFTERSADKVARLDPRTGLFTEWTLPAGAFPNRLAVTPDGAVWFTALFGEFLGRIKDGELRMYPIAGGPVGLTYYRGRLWASLFTGSGLAEISLHGTVLRTWTIPDKPLQVAGSNGRLWLTGDVSVWSVDPDCR
jgi:virginiamycin B lyase